MATSPHGHRKESANRNRQAFENAIDEDLRREIGASLAASDQSEPGTNGAGKRTGERGSASSFFVRRSCLGLKTEVSLRPTQVAVT